MSQKLSQSKEEGSVEVNHETGWKNSPIVKGIGFTIGYIAVKYLPIEVVRGLVFGGLGGLVLGLIPFLIFRYRKDPEYGKSALAWCGFWGALGGVILGLISVFFFIGKALLLPPTNVKKESPSNDKLPESEIY